MVRVFDSQEENSKGIMTPWLRCLTPQVGKAGERENRIEDDRVSDPQDDSAEGNMAPWQRVWGAKAGVELLKSELKLPLLSDVRGQRSQGRLWLPGI